MANLTPGSSKSVSSECSPVDSSAMSSLTYESSEKTSYRKRGSSFDHFIENNKDWRSFGSVTYQEMKENGYVDILMKKISIYNNARTNKARHKAVICSSELPLSEAASRLLDTKMRVVELIMDGISKDPSGGVTKLSEDIAFYNKLDPAVHAC